MRLVGYLAIRVESQTVKRYHSFMKITLSVDLGHRVPEMIAAVCMPSSAAIVAYVSHTGGLVLSDSIQLAAITIYGQLAAYLAGSRPDPRVA
jgi:hypothetical protein